MGQAGWRAAWWLPAALATYLVFRIVYLYYYNFYFVRGDEFDLNIFTWLLWRDADFGYLVTPSVSFFKIHIAPFLYALNRISFLVPVDPERWFSGTMAAIHAAFVPTFFALWLRLPLTPRLLWALPGALAAGVFALNGVVLDALWVGHYEFAIALAIVLLILALAAQKSWAVAAALIFLLSLREDAGFHAFGFLFLLILGRRVIYGTSWRALRLDLIAAGLCLGYSLFCFLWLMPHLDAYGVFKIVFVGDPAWAHLSWQRLGAVLNRHAQENQHLWIPAAVLSLAAIVCRRPLYLVGVLAPLPWTLLHMAAADDHAAFIDHYKAFPWIVTLAWPLLMDICYPQDRPPPPITAAVTALVLVGTLVNATSYISPFNTDNRWRIAGLHPCAADRSAYNRFRTVLQQEREALGRVQVSSGLYRYGLGLFQKHEHRLWYEPDVLRNLIQSSPDTVLYYAHGRAAGLFKDGARFSGLRRHYAVTGTPLLLSTRRDLGNHPALGEYLRPVKAWIDRGDCAPSWSIKLRATGQ
ncbi:MAG: hypothetical protein ACFB22_15460 [Rhodothalassiaceae bacterium]